MSISLSKKDAKCIREALEALEEVDSALAVDTRPNWTATLSLYSEVDDETFIINLSAQVAVVVLINEQDRLLGLLAKHGIFV